MLTTKTVIFIQNLVPAQDSARFLQSFDKLIVDLSGSSRQGLLSGIAYVISYAYEFPTGASVAKSGPELASDLGGAAGEPAHVSAIYNFHQALTDVRRTQLGVEADNQTIVFSGGTGYRFSDSVTVRDARNADELRRYKTLHECPELIRLKLT